MGIHNICFYAEIDKIIQELLSKTPSLTFSDLGIYGNHSCLKCVFEYIRNCMSQSHFAYQSLGANSFLYE